MFHSESPFVSVRVNTCPNNCSSRGECRVGNNTASVYCECEDNWKGEACDVPYCLSDCGHPERGRCQDKTCLCVAGWQGGLDRCVSAGSSLSASMLRALMKWMNNLEKQVDMMV